MFPDALRYTSEHEWVSAPDGDGIVRVGITDYAQETLGDIVYVALPDVGADVTARQPVGEVESTKSVAEIYAPVSGTVVARNDRLDQQPELINAEPYGDGWICQIRLADLGETETLLDAPAYQALVAPPTT